VEFLPLIGIVLLFWLFIIRPQARRQKELRSMQSSLSSGDEVMLTSGIFGRVQEVTDDHLIVEIATGVEIKVAPGAIGNKIHPVDAVEESDELTEPTDPTEQTEPTPDEIDQTGTRTDGPEER
jgi:preprotein translocase subunit YajC